MDERAKKIADGLQAADRAQHDLELAKDNIVKKLQAAKREAAVIIEQANNRSVQIVEEAKEHAREEIGIIKFFCAKVLTDVIDRALQSLGAAGMTDDFPIASYYRSERASRIYDGPDEVHKISVAKQVLKRYAAELTAES